MQERYLLAPLTGQVLSANPLDLLAVGFYGRRRAELSPTLVAGQRTASARALALSARLVGQWVEKIDLEPGAYGAHSLRPAGS